MGKNSNTSLIFPSLKRGNLVEMVFESLKQNICEGSFKDGDVLPNQELLAKQFGVSRTVMREAMNKLSSLGLIKSHQGRGTYVKSPDMKSVMRPMLSSLLIDESTISELIEARYHLESTVVRLAALRATKQQVQLLEKSIEQMEQGFEENDVKAFALADLAFHMQLADMSKNQVLTRIIEVIREMLAEFLEHINQVPGAQEKAIDYHKKICRAICEKDPDLAETQIRNHIKDVRRTLQKENRISREIC